MIEIDSKNQELLEQYYYHAVDMRRLAKAIGVEAAHIGVAASGVAIKAVVNAFSGLFDDDDDVWTEDELEISEEKLEKYSAKIEVLGRALELTVDDIEHIHSTLRRTVPELEDLDWF